LENHGLIPVFNLQLFPLSASLCAAPTALAGHVPSLNYPRAAPLRATCCSSTPPAAHPTALASPRLTTPLCHPLELLPAAAHRRFSTTSATSYSWQPPRVAPRPVATLVLPTVFFRTRHAAPPLPELGLRPPRTPSAASTSSRSLWSLLNLKCVFQLPVPSLLHSRTHICTAFPFPELSTSPDLRCSYCSSSTAAATTAHPRSSALEAPPPPTGAPQPAQFHSLAPERPDHSAGELELPPPLGLAVIPVIHCLLVPAKHTTSTTSSGRSCLASSPPPSSTLATGTPSPSLGAPPPASVRHRYAASVPLFPNTGHAHDRRELLNLSPHFPLAAGEPHRRNLIGTDRLSCVARPRTQLQRFESFQGPFCRKSIPLSNFKSANL
jgi:hypothetical protein